MTTLKGTHQYPKIYALGSAEVADILKYQVEVTEKVDGSQIGFGVINGELIIRSKSSLIVQSQPNKLFANATAYIISIKDRLDPGWFYYGECLQSPRHNKLKYERVPRNNIALYGVKDDEGVFCAYDEVHEIASILEVDCVPLLGYGHRTVEDLERYIKLNKSFLGGDIEGIVINSGCGLAKLVRQEFKEVMREKRPKAVQGDTDKAVQETFAAFCTQARWDKAIQHLRESGEIVGSNSDIGLIIREIQRDVLEEEGEYVKELLWSMFRRKFLSAVVEGFPKYYQERLLAQTVESRTPNPVDVGSSPAQPANNNGE